MLVPSDRVEYQLCLLSNDPLRTHAVPPEYYERTQDNIILETDSLTLVKALKSQEYDLAPGGVLFREAKFIMVTMFNSTLITHVYRSCNTVDHDLARFGRDRDLDHPVIWSIPSQFL